MHITVEEFKIKLDSLLELTLEEFQGLPFKNQIAFAKDYPEFLVIRESSCGFLYLSPNIGLKDSRYQCFKDSMVITYHLKSEDNALAIKSDLFDFLLEESGIGFVGN